MPPKCRVKIDVHIIGILALGILFSVGILAPKKSPVFSPKIAEDNENDWRWGAKNLTEGITIDRLSATDDVDYWMLPMQDPIDIITIVLTSEAGTDFGLSFTFITQSNVIKNVSSNGRFEVVIVSFKPDDVIVQRNSGEGWYKLQLTIVRRTISYQNLFWIEYAIFIASAVFLILAYVQSRGARTYLERFEKMRLMLLVGLLTVGCLVLCQTSLAITDLLVSDTYLQNLGVMPNPLALTSLIATSSCVILEILFAYAAFKRRSRGAYISARNVAVVENTFDTIDATTIIMYSILANSALGITTNASNLLNALMFILIARIIRKFILAFYGRSYGVLSFRKSDRIYQVFREKYEQLDEVLLGTLMKDFYFNPKNTGRAEKELTKLVQIKTIPGDYDAGTKTYYPQGSYSTKRALEKMTGEQRLRLLEMVQNEGKIDITHVKETVGLGETDIKGLIFDLVGDGKFEGKFNGNEFILTSDIGRFITALDKMFSEWGGSTVTGEGKKVG